MRDLRPDLRVTLTLSTFVSLGGDFTRVRRNDYATCLRWAGQRCHWKADTPLYRKRRRLLPARTASALCTAGLCPPGSADTQPRRREYQPRNAQMPTSIIKTPSRMASCSERGWSTWTASTLQALARITQVPPVFWAIRIGYARAGGRQCAWPARTVFPRSPSSLLDCSIRPCSVSSANDGMATLAAAPPRCVGAVVSVGQNHVALPDQEARQPYDVIQQEVEVILWDEPQYSIQPVA